DSPARGACFFFFSSRRRHTRFDCDWSSDVCSSDLSGVAHVLLELAQGVVLAPAAGVAHVGPPWAVGQEARHHERRMAKLVAGTRSEERRVGKEGGSGGWAERGKQRSNGVGGYYRDA